MTLTSILVLGSTGLLGATLAAHYNVIPVSRAECDITDPVSVASLLSKYRPEIVINCAGVVPKVVDRVGIMQTLRVNALGPKLLRSACTEYGTRLIQISTDCVFTGSMGHYDEESIPNPADMYGLSKYLGEVYDLPHLTIRTSFIGLPDAGGRGLLHWASEQPWAVGWDQVKWNGLTTTEFGNILFNKIIPSNISGLLHVYGETVSKYDVLMQAKEVYGWDIDILQESKIVNLPAKHTGKRTLTSLFPEFQTLKSLKQMLQEMKDGIPFHNYRNDNVVYPNPTN